MQVGVLQVPLSKPCHFREPRKCTYRIVVLSLPTPDEIHVTPNLLEIVKDLVGYSPDLEIGDYGASYIYSWSVVLQVGFRHL